MSRLRWDVRGGGGMKRNRQPRKTLKPSAKRTHILHQKHENIDERTTERTPPQKKRKKTGQARRPGNARSILKVQYCERQKRENNSATTTKTTAEQQQQQWGVRIERSIPTKTRQANTDWTTAKQTNGSFLRMTTISVFDNPLCDPSTARKIMTKNFGSHQESRSRIYDTSAPYEYVVWAIRSGIYERGE